MERRTGRRRRRGGQLGIILRRSSALAVAHARHLRKSSRRPLKPAEADRPAGRAGQHSRPQARRDRRRQRPRDISGRGGRGASPSPTGEFQIVSRVANPTYYHPGIGDPERQRQSGGNALAGTEPEGLWNSWHECAAVRSDMRLRTGASGCAIAIWSGCSPCCRSATWCRFAASATSKLRRYSEALRTIRRWLRRKLPDQTAGNSSR